MKAEAPAALLSKTSQPEKTAGAAAKALASAAIKKGITPFWRLMSAMVESGDAAAEKDAATVKKGLAMALAGKTVKTSALKLQAAVLRAEIKAETEKEPKAEKASVKKAARPHAASGFAQVDPAPTQMDKKTVDAAHRQEAGADAKTAAAVRADGARPVTAKTPEPTIRIVDLRTKKETAEAVSAAHGAKTALAAEHAKNGDDTGASFTQRLSAQRDAGPELPQRPEPAAPTQTQTPLERLQDMAGSELTRATNLILKDGGGEIRLVLKPESLGSVRIRMHIVDNAIEGTIIVDSSAVKHVIDGSIDALRRAFTAEGFQTGSLNVSVGGQSAGGGARRDRDDGRPASVRRMESALGFSQNIPGAENASMGDLLVNLFV